MNETFRDFYSQLYVSESQADHSTIVNFLTKVLTNRNIPKVSLEHMKSLQEYTYLPYLRRKSLTLCHVTALGPRVTLPVWHRWRS